MEMEVKSDNQTELALDWLKEQIDNLSAETSGLSEKVQMREHQIQQTSDDLQDAYNKLIKQSQKECEISLKEILDSQVKDYFETSQTNIDNQLSILRQQIETEISKYNSAQSLSKHLHNYEEQIKETSNSLSKKLTEKIDNLNSLNLLFINNKINSLNSETNTSIFGHSCEKQNMKLGKLKEEVAELETNFHLLATKRNETFNRIIQLSDKINAMSEKISISIRNKEMNSFSYENNEIISVPPVYQRKKLPERNVLVLAPIHSLTRQMHGTKVAPRFFSTKSFH